MRRLYEPYAYTDAARAECVWQASTDLPRLDGDLACEVAVIGGGYTGLSAALHLAQAGVGVTLLEAELPGWGASGRNGGFCCMGGAMAHDAALARRFGRDQADSWVSAQRGAIDLVAGLLEAHNIDADRHSDGEVVLAHRPRVMHEFNGERARLARHGIAADIIARAALAERGLTAQGAHGALHVKTGFALDPGKYATGLGRAAQSAGADIRAHTPVEAIQRDNAGFRLTTPQGTVTAKRLILATNGYSAEDLPKWLRARTMPLQSNILVTRKLTEGERAAQGWTSDLMAYDSRNLLHYFRLMPDGRFLFGMRGGTRAGAARDAAMRDRIRHDFEAMFPAWAGVETPHFWSGLLNLSRGLTPYVGPVPDMPGAFVAMAYHGNGVAMASYSGALVADLVQGAVPRLPFPTVMQAPLGRFPLGRFRRVLLDASYRAFALRDAL